MKPDFGKSQCSLGATRSASIAGTREFGIFPTIASQTSAPERTGGR